MANENKDTSQELDTKDVGLDVEKAKFEKERINFDIAKLQDSKEKAELELISVNTQITKVKEELDGVKSNIGNKTTELDALLKTKMAYEEEISSKKTEIEDISKVIEAKQTELNELEEVRVLEATNTKTSISFKKNGKVFSAENKPVVRIIAPEDRLSKKSWGSVNTNDIKKIAYLSESMNDCFAFIDNKDNGWEKYQHPVYQIFQSDEDGIDFDVVLNTNGLKSAIDYVQSKAGISLDSKQKKSMSKFFVNKYKTLEEIGQGTVPENLKKVAESKVVFETTKPYLDALLEGLLSDNIIDLDDSEVVEQSTDDEDVVIKLDDENTNITLQTIAQTLSTILGSDELNKEKEAAEAAAEAAAAEAAEAAAEAAILEAAILSAKISAEDAKRVIEQFNPSDESLDVNKELTKFVDLLLTNNDGTKTPFAETYELSEGSDVYAMYGVVKDSFVNGDFTTALQILKGVAGTLFVNIKNATAPVTVQSTEAAKDLNVVNDIPATDVSITAPIDAPIEATPTDVTSDIPTETLKLTDVQIINYAHNMSTLILARYEEVQDIFAGITSKASEIPPVDTTMPIDTTEMSQIPNTNEQTTITDPATKIFEQNINDNNNNGGTEMDSTKLIEMLKENFESQDDINDENVLEAVGSIISDFIETTEKCTEMEKELNEFKAGAITALKNEKTSTLESLGVDKATIEDAFAAASTAEEIEAKFEELNKVISSITTANKVTESTQKVILTRKGTANPDEVVPDATQPKDNFDRLMDSI